MRKKQFRLAMAHVAVVSSLTLAVLLVLGDINPRMGFMRCGLSLATAAVSICSSIYFGVGEIVRQARGAAGRRGRGGASVGAADGGSAGEIPREGA